MRIYVGDLYKINNYFNVSLQTPLEIAQEYKVKGNKLFKIGKFDKAIEQYNLAIEACPKEFTKDLATFYQNRAAAYESLVSFLPVFCF